MPPDAELHLPLEGEDAATVLDRVHHALEELWRTAGDVGEIDRIAVETALVEVAGNVVRHGPDGRWHGDGVHLTVRPDVVVAVARQAGPPPMLDLVPTMPSAEAESGRGLAIVAALVDVTCTAEGHGTRWTLTRRRTA